MKNIKFRAYSKELKQMFEIQKYSFKTNKAMPYNYNISYDFGNLMQYIGLQDINGQDIYEGDIVVAKVHTGAKFIGVVSFEIGSFCIKSDNFFIKEWMNYRIEVIGNIYENKALLNETFDEFI